MAWEQPGRNGLGKLLGIARSGLGRAGASFRVEATCITYPLVHWAKGYIGVTTTVDARLRQCQTS